MRTIDIHAHITPPQAVNLPEGGDWHGITSAENGGRKFLVVGPKRHWVHPSYAKTTEERIAEMDALGVDVHVLSTWTQLYNYELPLEQGAAACRDCNDHVIDMVLAHPTRFAGLATLPMQDVAAAIQELERCQANGLKGAQINDHVNGVTLDHPDFLPFWKAVEELGALILFHQVENETMVESRTTRYGLGNSIGNHADRTVTFGTLVFGGVLDRFPGLKLCLAHGGGFTCFGAGRMDRGWQVRADARVNIQQPPSRYLDRFYYDCLTHSERALRFIIDTAGIDRVFLGSDWPYNMGFESPVEWVNGLESLTQDEKDAILWKNLENALGI